ncbi:MAG: SGNH/GDSL hydrolase family protein [Methylibium sp.]
MTGISVVGQSKTTARLSLAVLGDSDSHAYHDEVFFPPSSPLRGGKLRDSTFQWTEILDRLRRTHVDQGEWGIWGVRGKVGTLLEWAGLSARMPRKQDFRFNFAVSGAECEDLMQGPWRQVPRLLSLMDEEPQRWQHGAVLIRIGIITLGKRADLDGFASQGATPQTKAQVEDCVRWIRKAVHAIRERHPQARVVLVGLASNVDWPAYLEYWRSANEVANIDEVLDLYDNSLRELARQDQAVTFFDDREWFRRYWGQRGPQGQSDQYKTVRLPSGLEVRNTAGDTLDNAIIADGHGGTVLNGLWALDLVGHLNGLWGGAIPPVKDAELDNFIQSLPKRAH